MCSLSWRTRPAGWRVRRLESSAQESRQSSECRNQNETGLDREPGNRLHGTMPVAALSNWLIRRMLRSPLAWLMAIILAGLPLAFLVLGPLGVASDPRANAAVVYELALLGGLFGCSFALA